MGRGVAGTAGVSARLHGPAAQEAGAGSLEPAVSRHRAVGGLPVQPQWLVSRTRDSSTFSGRGIPACCVAPSSHSAAMLGRRALPSGRRAPENLSTDLWFGTP